jgi:hypothetical protein
MKSEMTYETFGGRPIRAGDGIGPVKRNSASTEPIDSGANNETFSIQNCFEKA